MVIGFQPAVCETTVCRLPLAFSDGHLSERHLVDRIDLPREQRVDPRRVVRQFDEHELVDRRLVRPSSSRTARAPVWLARLEADELPRPRADRLLRVVADRDDVDDVAQHLVEERHRPSSGRTGRCDRRASCCASCRLRRAARPPSRRTSDREMRDREEHVVGGDGLAVVELEALLEPHGPDVAGRVGHALVTQPVMQLERAVEPDRASRRRPARASSPTAR